MPSYACVSGDVVRSVFVCTIPGQTSTNSRDWQVISISGGTTVLSSAILESLSTDIPGQFKAMMSSDANFYGIMLYKRTPVGIAPRPDTTNNGAGPGTVGVGLLPSQTCGLISLYSDTLGKTGQGRIYLPFPSPLSNDATGTPSGQYALDSEQLALSLTNNLPVVDGAVTAVIKPCLYRPGGPPPYFLNAHRSHDAWATQRKRGGFGRLNAPPF